MSNQQAKQPIPNGSKTEISADILKEWLSQQSQKIQLDKDEIKLREKEIDSNERLALKSMEHQAADNKSNPGQVRKTIALFAGIILLFTVLVIGTVCYLLSTGNKDFAYAIGKGVSYLATTTIGYFIGTRQNRKTSKNIDIPEAEIVSD